MAKKLFADGVSGKVAIYDPANPAAFTNPLANLQSVFFHSDLDYVGVAKIIDVTVTHPYRGVGGTAAQNSYAVPNFPAGNVNPLAHNLGYKPFGIAFVGNNMLPANSQIQDSGQSFRTVAIQVDENSVGIFESCYVYGSALPAINVTYKIVLFRQMTGQLDNKALHIEPDQFKAGFGKLDTDYNYLRYDAAAPDFYFSKGRTADVSNGSFRIVTANGALVQRSPYNGGFGGVPGIGVKI